MAAEQARRHVQGDAARSHGAAPRFVLDHLLHAVQVEGLARQAGGVVHAEAIMDRIVHGTVWLEMGDVSMRDIYG